MWNGDSGVRRCLGSVNELPYADGSFDAVISVDVLQTKQVDPQASMNEMARVTRRAGSVVMLAPAYQWMLSTHDRAVHSVRRFTRPALRNMAVMAGLSVERITHLFPLFFPIIAATRLARKAYPRNGDAPVRSDLSPLPRWMNATLLACARAEFTIARHLTVPFGSTILAVARKD